MSDSGLSELSFDAHSILDPKMLLVAVLILTIGIYGLYSLRLGLEFRARPIIAIQLLPQLGQQIPNAVVSAENGPRTTPIALDNLAEDVADAAQNTVEPEDESVDNAAMELAESGEDAESPQLTDVQAMSTVAAGKESYADIISRVNRITSGATEDTGENPATTAETQKPASEQETRQVQDAATAGKSVWIAGLNNDGKVYKAKSVASSPIYNTISTEMLDAVDSGSAEEVLWLLSQGQEVNATNEFGESSLLKAAWNGDLAMVRALLDHGADVLLASDDGRTPLYSAAVSGSLSVIKLLIDARANIDTKTDVGKTALMVSASGNNTSVSELLLERNADPNVIDNLGRNALFYALWNRNMRVVQALVAGGADVKLTDSLGQSAIGIARLREIDLGELGLTEAEIEQQSGFVNEQ